MYLPPLSHHTPFPTGIISMKGTRSSTFSNVVQIGREFSAPLLEDIILYISRSTNMSESLQQLIIVIRVYSKLYSINYFTCMINIIISLIYFYSVYLCTLYSLSLQGTLHVLGINRRLKVNTIIFNYSKDFLKITDVTYPFFLTKQIK